MTDTVIAQLAARKTVPGVQRQQQRRVDLARQRLDVRARLVVQVGHRQFRAQGTGWGRRS